MIIIIIEPIMKIFNINGSSTGIVYAKISCTINLKPNKRFEEDSWWDNIQAEMMMMMMCHHFVPIYFETSVHDVWSVKFGPLYSPLIILSVKHPLRSFLIFCTSIHPCCFPKMTTSCHEYILRIYSDAEISIDLRGCFMLSLTSSVGLVDRRRYIIIERWYSSPTEPRVTWCWCQITWEGTCLFQPRDCSFYPEHGSMDPLVHFPQ